MRNAASVSHDLHESCAPRGARIVRVVSMRVGAFIAGASGNVESGNYRPCPDFSRAAGAVARYARRKKPFALSVAREASEVETPARPSTSALRACAQGERSLWAVVR